MLQLEHLTKQYGSHTAVRDVSFTVAPGQVIGFLGRNGAGKSTTMNMITGYLAPTSGRVLWNGEDALSLGGAYLQEVGYLPEIPPLYPELTVREMLDFVCGLKLIRGGKKKKHIDDVIGLTQLGQYRDKPIKGLSKGYKQRVGLAMALIGNPTLLVLDEPTVGLDPEQIVSIRELIRALGRDHAVLLSSHILSEIQDVCTGLVVLRKGQVVASGTMEQIAAEVSAGESRLRIRTRGEKALPLLQAMDGVRHVEPLPRREHDWDEYLLIADKDKADEAARVLTANSYPVRLIYPLDAELEDVFLRLTREEREPDADRILP